MHYLLFYEKTPDHAEREKPLQAAHRTHVLAAVARGELILGGPLTDPLDGAQALLFWADSANSVEAFAAADPYVRHGIVNRWRMRPWRTVVGVGAAFPLPEPEGTSDECIGTRDGGATWCTWLLGERQVSSPGYPCEECGKLATVFLLHISGRNIAKEQRFCGHCASENLWIPNPTPSTGKPNVPGPNQAMRMEVEKLLFYSGSWQQYIILREAGGPRRLTLTTGYFEATALRWFLKGEPHSRPPTHAAWLNTVTALGCKVESACVKDRHEDTYFADIRLLRGQDTIAVDVRPSDALLFAMRAGVPFCFTEQLLARYAVSEPEPA